MQLALAEVAHLQGNPALAQEALQAGQALVQRCNLPQALHELRLRQPLLLAAGETLQTPSSAGPLENRESLLSLRELQVLQLIAQGCSNQQIAEQLFISLHTVKTHGRRIHSKLGVERRTQAVAKAQALGLMS